jgi:hypothetical protein
VIRSIDADKTFEDEERKPHLGNLATHSRKHSKETDAAFKIPEISNSSLPKGVTAASAKIMEGFLKEGALNPEIVPTQKGFLRVFAA